MRIEVETEAFFMLEKGMVEKRTRSIVGHLFRLNLLTSKPGKKISSFSQQPFYAVTVLERLPVVAPLSPASETEYLEWMKSKGRAFEGKQLPTELGDGGGGGVGKGKKGAAAASAAENDGEEDKGKWRPASRETEADRAGDVTSLRRCLDKRLFLVLDGSSGGGSGGESKDALKALPSAEIKQGETTRASAERALTEAVPALSPEASSSSSSSVEAYFVGNAPAGHFALPQNKGTLFFHRAQLVAAGGGDLLSASDSLFPPTSANRSGSGGEPGHAWLTREELAERLEGGDGLRELLLAML